MPELTQDQATLLDKLACRTLMETFSYAEIRRDPDLFVSLWSEDARFGGVHGRDEIRASAVGFFKAMEGISDLRISPAGWFVEVDGDTADGRFYIVSQLRIPQDDGSVKIMHMDATYRTKFVRGAEGWRISEVRGDKNPSLFHDSDIMVQLQGAAKVTHDFS
ncbi:MAG: nuclear transport factor 2 family protein [Novosphingobium sp.]|nr:nuclear transport factor 2 family protein [Novosphingobium sp.]